MAKKSKTQKKLDGKSAASKSEVNASMNGDEKANRSDSTNSFRPFYFVVAILILSIASASYYYLTQKSDSQLQDACRQAYSNKEFETGISFIQQLESRKSARASDYLVAAKCEVGLERKPEAIAWLSKIDDQQGLTSFDARLMQGELETQIGNSKRAFQQFKKLRAIAPESVEANRITAQLLNLLGRRVEAQEYLKTIIKNQKGTIEDLAIFGNRHRSVDIVQLSQRFLAKHPDDQSPRLNQAKAFVKDDRTAEAIKILEQIVKADSKNSEADVWLGRAYEASGDSVRFSNWYENASDETKKHPDFWTAVGIWAANNGQADAAKRCFWESIKADPDNMLANYRLAVLLGRDKKAEPFRERANLLRRLDESLLRIQLNVKRLNRSRHEPILKQISENMEALGRIREAHAWCTAVAKIDSNISWAVTKKTELESRIKPEMGFVVKESNPANQVDLSKFPLPTIGGTKSTNTDGNKLPQNRFKFDDVAKASGIDFQYENGGIPGKPVQQMFELMGGGIGILDFDGDDFPDIYLAQGSKWPNNPEQEMNVDRIFKNLGNGQFEEVTLAAQIAENGFSQGVGVGDFDNDGFDDLYVANIGQNRIFINNGDGTFSDSTTESGIDTELWTTSVAIADINGDGFPDIYDVNYLQSDDLFQRLCNIDGKKRSCPPTQFKSAQDQLWINQGNGKFENVTETSGIKVPRGNGLGIVAADFNNDQAIDLFVANDETANFFFENQTRKQVPRAAIFSEMAELFNVGYDRDGNPEGCMGIAFGFLNDDGRPDLFVTNYEGQTNTLYMSIDDSYLDQTRERGLSRNGEPYVGFGTQLFDADLDGDQDLMTTNGHVTDFTDLNRDLKMPVELLENKNSKFKLVDSSTLGEFFQKKFVGRAMAKLDFDLDGRVDIAISNLLEPFTLLKNSSEVQGSFLTIKLVGRESSRTAIGASVEIEVDGKKIRNQLTSGDGFQASNQRVLHFGFGKVDTAKKIIVTWPNSKSQTFDNVALNRHLIVVEGSDELTELAK